MRIAEIVASRSNCIKRGVGALIVDPHKKIVSQGYNGTPGRIPNCNEGGCPRCNSPASQGQKLDECFCVHAEENAILFAGIERAKGCSIYVTTYPCIMCTKMIIQAGIKRIVYNVPYESKLTSLLLSYV